MTLINCFLLPGFTADDIMPIVNARLLGKHIITGDDVFIVEATSLSQTDVIILYVKRDKAKEAVPLTGDTLFGFKLSIVVHGNSGFLMGNG